MIIAFQIRCEIDGSNMEIKEGSWGKRENKRREEEEKEDEKEKEKEQILFSQEIVPYFPCYLFLLYCN